MTQHTNFTFGMAFDLLWGCTFSSSPTGDPKSGLANRPPIIQSAAITRVIFRMPKWYVHKWTLKTQMAI